MTQDATIFNTTWTLTPCPRRRRAGDEDGGGVGRRDRNAQAGRAEDRSDCADFAANPELARNGVIRRPIVSMIFQLPHTVPSAMAL